MDNNNNQVVNGNQSQTENDYNGDNGNLYADFENQQQQGDEYDEAVEGEGYNEGEAEPEDMTKRVQEMEDEINNLTKIQQQVEKQIISASDKIDENSVYVGQVDYDATIDELRAHFAPCGTVNRVTIMCDKITGQPKGFAYIEFLDKESVDNALKLDDSIFRGRQLKVLPKRQNVPVRGGRSGRGSGYGPAFAGRGRGGRGAYHPVPPYRGGGRFSNRGRGYPAPGRFRGPSRGGYRAPAPYHNTYY